MANRRLEQIEELARRGETQTVEMMAEINEENLCRTISAFANTARGSILLGVKEPGRVVYMGAGPAPKPDILVGVDLHEFRSFRAKLSEKFDPMCPVLTIEEMPFETMREAIIVITVEIPEFLVGLKDGRCFKRVGAQNVEMKEQEKAAFRRIKTSAPTGRATASTESSKPGGGDRIAVKDATMPVAEANYPVTSGDGSTEAEPKSPSEESKIVESAFEAKGTSEAKFDGDAIRTSEAAKSPEQGESAPTADGIKSAESNQDAAEPSVLVASANLVIGGAKFSAGASVADKDSPLPDSDVEATLGLPVLTSETDRIGTPQDSEAEATLGVGLPMRRKATAVEHCLDLDKYARVIAALFRRIPETEQMCFGLFGHWGRGKTTLANEVARELENEGYRSITFSAWKYRTNPELWIHLYETVVTVAGNSNWFLPIRASFVRLGPWPAILAIWAFFGSLQTIGQTVGSLHSAIQWIGLVGLLYAAFLYFRIRSFSARLKQLYWAVPRHAEKLGMQATIGKDLKSLLLAWLPGDRFHWERGSRPAWLTEKRERRVCAVAYAFGCFLVFVQLVRMPMVESLNGILSKGFGITSVGWAGAIAVAALWAGFTVAAPLVTFIPTVATRKGLLIVDDLDRCQPSQMVEVLESLLLLLDDDEINRRLQILVLVDEGVLIHALAKKYADLIEDTHSVGKLHKFTAQRIAAENMEKFFFIHLRLNELDSFERLDVMRGVTPNVNPTAAQWVTTKLASGATLSVAVSEQISANDEVKAKEEPAPVNVELTESEGLALRERTGDMKTTVSGRRWGPRAIRSFKFRYMLARELLRELGAPKRDPKIITEKLLAAMQWADPAATVPGDGPVDQVINQVA